MKRQAPGFAVALVTVAIVGLALLAFVALASVR